MVAVFCGSSPLEGAQDASTTGWTVYHGAPLGTGVAAGVRSVNTAAPGLDVARPRRPPLRPAARGRRGRLRGDRERHRLRPVRDQRSVVWSAHVAPPVPSSSPPVRRHLADGRDHRHPGHRPGQGRDLRRGRRAASTAAPPTSWSGSASTPGPSGCPRPSTRRAPTRGPPPAHRAHPRRREVVFGFGGNYGDCGNYRGRVASVPEAGGTAAYFTVDAAQARRQGAVWMGGAAPVSTPTATSGWPSATVRSPRHASGYDDSDSVLELTPALTLMQYFAPTTWPSDNASDLDFSTAPALLADGQVVAAGKSHIAYLLNSGTPRRASATSRRSSTGPARRHRRRRRRSRRRTVYLPCLTGPVAVRGRHRPRPCTSFGVPHSGGGPPIVAGGSSGRSARTARSSGSTRPRAPSSSRRRWASPPTTSHARRRRRPAARAGANRVVAFSSSPAPPATTTTTVAPTTTSRTAAPATTVAVPTTHPTSAAQSGTTAWVWVLVGLALTFLVGGALYLLLRWRRRPPEGPGPLP